MITRTADLISHIQTGHSVKYLAFWGHTPKTTDRVDKSCLSQWYEASFVVDGVRYRTAEHYMMAQKALLFNDEAAYRAILNSPHPKQAKEIGREIHHFSEEVWVAHRFSVVVAGNLAKFSQHEELRAFLLSTGNRVLVEASPVDTIWGVGLAVNDVNIEQPEHWRGLNLLGFALMRVRSLLLESE
mgnify:CR=1 FL=1